MKVIKNRYTIQFNGCDSFMSKEIDISKDEYLKNISFLEKLVDSSIDDEIPVTVDFQIYNLPKYTEKVYYFKQLTSTTILSHKIIKDGYRFLNKNEQ